MAALPLRVWRWSNGLITSPATPLYGTEVEPLRQELRRARYLLTAHATSERSRRG